MSKTVSRLLSIILTAILLTAAVLPATVSAADPEYYAVGSDDVFGGWGIDSTKKMTLGADGKYTFTVTTTQAYSAVNMKVVEDNGTSQNWYGMPDGSNVMFDVKGAGQIVVTFDPSTHEIKISGSAYATPVLSYSYVTVAGNGEGAFLGGASWDPAAEANKMTEVSPDVWEITYTGVQPKEGWEVKFTLDGGWDVNFGGQFEKSGAVSEAVLDGFNIWFSTVDVSDVTLRLDLSNFDLAAKSGAAFSVTVIPQNVDDTYYVVGTDPLAGWNAFVPENVMTQGADGKYTAAFNAVAAVGRVELKVVKLVANDATDKVWYGNADESNVAFGLSDAGRFTVTFDPETNEVTVTGDKVTEAAAPAEEAPSGTESKQTGDAVIFYIIAAAAAAATASVAAVIGKKRRRIDF